MTFTKVLRDIGLGEEATPHGMRSAFKVWCAEVAKVRDEVSEAALAHTIPEKVRAAYLRTDFLEERKASWSRGQSIVRRRRLILGRVDLTNWPRHKAHNLKVVGSNPTPATNFSSD